MQINFANATKQHTLVCFRFAKFPDPESKQLVRIPCQAGAQVTLFAGEQDAVAFIVMQLEQTGAVDIDELDRAQGIVRAVYSIDRPIDMKKVARQIEKNDVLLGAAAFTRRKNTAIAAHVRQNDLAAQGGPSVPRPHNTVMDLSEVPRLGEEQGGAEVIEVATEGHEPLVRGGRVSAVKAKGRRKAA